MGRGAETGEGREGEGCWFARVPVLQTRARNTSKPANAELRTLNGFYNNLAPASASGLRSPLTRGMWAAKGWPRMRWRVYTKPLLRLST